MIAQLSQLHLPSTSYNTCPQTHFRNPPPISTHHSLLTQLQHHPVPIQGTWPPKQPPPTKEQVLERVIAIPQRPNLGEGKQQYKVNIDAWYAAHGADATVSLSQPYPIIPDTALPGLGECFECRMITEPRHTSGNCESKNHVPPLEAKWQQTVVGMLCCTVQPQIQPIPVQYVWSYPPTQPTYQQTQTPVMMVDTQDDNTIQDTTFWDNNQDGAWDWQENDQGLQH